MIRVAACAIGYLGSVAAAMILLAAAAFALGQGHVILGMLIVVVSALIVTGFYLLLSFWPGTERALTLAAVVVGLASLVMAVPEMALQGQAADRLISAAILIATLVALPVNVLAFRWALRKVAARKAGAA